MALVSQNQLRKNEAGNILIYILGAIFLLGILTMVVRGSNTPGAGIDQEELLIRIAEVQEYGRELEQAVSYIMSNGHSEADIRFAHPNAPSAYGDVTDEPTRQVFSRQGGGAVYREIPAGIQVVDTPFVFSGRNAVGTVGTGINLTSSGADLVALLPNVSENFCTLIAKKNNLLTAANTPPQDCSSAQITTPFTGSYDYSNHIEDSAGCGGTALIANALEGCFEGETSPSAGTYHYYRVLLAR